MQKILQWEFLTRKNTQTRAQFTDSLKFLETVHQIFKIQKGEVSLLNNKSDFVNYLTSLIYPFIDGYWVTLTFINKFLIGKQTRISLDQLRTRIQWLAETLHDDGYIKFYESCSMDVIKTSIYAFAQMGVLKKVKKKKQVSRKVQTIETYYEITEELL